MTAPRPAFWLLVAGTCGLLGFGYGYVSHWKQIFPYQLHRPLGEFVHLRLLGENRARTGKPPGSEGGTDLQEKTERLMSLGYAAGYSAKPSLEGVRTFVRDKAFPGLNLVVSAHLPAAYLIDMDGRVLHRWEKTFGDAFREARTSVRTRFWKRVHLYDNGDLLALFEGGGIIKLDRASKLLWSVNEPVHHDLDVDSEGTIFVLTKRAHVVSRIHESEPILEDFITLLDPRGVKMREISLLEAFEKSSYASFLGFAGAAGDIFHTNTITVLTGEHGARIPGFRRGNLLVCFRHLSVVAVIDPQTGAIVWALSGLWRWPHEPVVLENGNLLIFDNRGGGKRRSRVLEVDPSTQAVAWSYAGPEPFYSDVAGVVQRLANGNTLVTVSTEGRAFETTTGGQVVWEFLSPFEVESDVFSKKRVATLFELIRLDPGRVRWLASLD